ncbi:HAD hydrolase-like protein [Jeotgalibaca sp. MA1X17-3]|uniref:HAD family hydrolase n=1 Tax=Jeotgalibaca sp. MA1X17-3 TaxID=2908211 RepID=UPI001F31DEE5|nr:HAD hydrolase-like protein [Jeotgalibaca sp. MA1X17-3]UJF16175.1 HAD hydrolase-like protein [Jeotgalibaca sp. MA1X17-3]
MTTKKPEYFKKKNNFIVGVDSDGCAMDTMDIKHERFFGPISADVFNVKDREVYLEDWNKINLFSNTRGINRFKALVMALQNAQGRGENIGDISALRNWTDTASSLSNGSLELLIQEAPSSDLVKTFDWSKQVNHGIETELAGEDNPFTGVKESLEYIARLTDLAIISSANSEAINSEWNRHELMPLVDVTYGQETGSKAEAISDLIKKGYDRDCILMVGDAPGDEIAAEVNDVLYYPILFGKEEECWKRLRDEAMSKFMSGEYRGEYQNHLKKNFMTC